MPGFIRLTLTLLSGVLSALASNLTHEANGALCLCGFVDGESNRGGTEVEQATMAGEDVMVWWVRAEEAADSVVASTRNR